jgi:hypothetical protein
MLPLLLPLKKMKAVTEKSLKKTRAKNSLLKRLSMPR